MVEKSIYWDVNDVPIPKKKQVLVDGTGVKWVVINRIRHCQPAWYEIIIKEIPASGGAR